jgi:hypothetical protein
VLPAFTIAQIYKCRWQVELFFKWIKQHKLIKLLNSWPQRMSAVYHIIPTAARQSLPPEYSGPSPAS